MPDDHLIINAEAPMSEKQRWADLAIKAGFPLLAAAFLTYFLTVKIDAKLDNILVMQQTLLDSQRREEAQTSLTTEQMWQLIAVGQATCLSVASTPENRLSCVAVRKTQ